VTLRAPDFALDPEQLRAALSPATRFVLLNSPHNPTGRVLSGEELSAVAGLAIEHDLTVITDEVYEHLTFGVPSHRPIATWPGMAQRTLTISSIGKSYSLTGWKIGWATGPAHLTGAVLAAKQWLTFVSGGPLQPAAAYALASAPDFPRQLAGALAARRDLLLAGLSAAGVPAGVPEGTYFAISDTSHLGWADATEFCLALPERAGVVAIPAQGFYADHPEAGRHLVRWTFCKKPEVLTEAVNRLAAADLHR
jgi:N-succinyldiaminopimelate aminotransferase